MHDKMPSSNDIVFFYGCVLFSRSLVPFRIFLDTKRRIYFVWPDEKKRKVRSDSEDTPMDTDNPKSPLTDTTSESGSTTESNTNTTTDLSGPSDDSMERKPEELNDTITEACENCKTYT